MSDKKNNGQPSINEMTDIELSGKTGVGVDPKDVEKWLTALMKKATGLLERHQKNMTDNNETTDALLLFLDKYPELFADTYGEINRDMLKWALAENSKKNRQLIDKIQEIEKTLNLDIHHEW